VLTQVCESKQSKAEPWCHDCWGADLGAGQQSGALDRQCQDKGGTHKLARLSIERGESACQVLECLEMCDEALLCPRNPYDRRPARVQLRR
jgi:hypothetical protein